MDFQYISCGWGGGPGWQGGVPCPTLCVLFAPCELHCKLPSKHFVILLVIDGLSVDLLQLEVFQKGKMAYPSCALWSKMARLWRPQIFATHD